MPRPGCTTMHSSGWRNQITLRWWSRNTLPARLYEFAWAAQQTEQHEQKVMPDDHSKLVPLLPIPNRTVKRLRADDSADSRVKVGHRQAFIWNVQQTAGRFLLCSSGPPDGCKRREENVKTFKAQKFCARIQGFADYSELIWKSGSGACLWGCESDRSLKINSR